MLDVKKRFPADTKLEVLTFLNDKKVNAELYALLQSYSFPVEQNGQIYTIVQVKDLPTKRSMCQTLGIKSPKTFNSHLNYLVERGFVEIVEKDKKYLLPNKENIYFMIPLETMQYLNDTVQECVIKIFIYLGQRWKYKKMYVFTLEEIASHLGLSLDGSPRNRSKINNSLDLLSKLGLISYVEFYEDKKPRRRLVHFSLYIQDKTL